MSVLKKKMVRVEHQLRSDEQRQSQIFHDVHRFLKKEESYRVREFYCQAIVAPKLRKFVEKITNIAE